MRLYVNLTFNKLQADSLHENRLEKFALQKLLFAEGFAIGALVHCRVGLMGADFDAIKRAIIAGVAMMAAFCYGAFNTGITLGIHDKAPFDNKFVRGTVLFFATQRIIYTKNNFQKLTYYLHCSIIIL